MNNRSKALQLAKELVSIHQGHADEGPSTFSEAAAELRRLHSVNAELLEALQELVDLMEAIQENSYFPDSFTTQPARTAIAKAQE
jgi:hypothetical protein